MAQSLIKHLFLHHSVLLSNSTTSKLNSLPINKPNNEIIMPSKGSTTPFNYFAILSGDKKYENANGWAEIKSKKDLKAMVESMKEQNSDFNNVARRGKK